MHGHPEAQTAGLVRTGAPQGAENWVRFFIKESMKEIMV